MMYNSNNNSNYYLLYFVFLYLILFNFKFVYGDGGDKALIDTVDRNIDFSDFLGIGAQLQWFNDTVVTKQIEYLKRVNIRWIRVDIHLDFIAVAQNSYDWSTLETKFEIARQSNMSIVGFVAGTPKWLSSYFVNNPAGLNYTDVWPPTNNTVYGEILVAMDKKFPFVKYWELWNEMNLVPAFWAPSYNPQAYYTLYDECKKVMQSAGIASKLIVGSLGYYGNTDQAGVNMLNDLISAGNPYKGTVGSYHPYTEYPEGGPNQLPDSLYGNRNTTVYINNILKTHASATQVWASEWGWSTAEISETTQADYTLKRLIMDTINGLDKTFLFTTSDLDNRASSLRDQKYGLIDLNLNPKPIYNALNRFLNTILSGSSVGPIKSQLVINNSTPSMVFISFIKLSTNTSMLAYWDSLNTSTPSSVTLTNPSPSGNGRIYQLTTNTNTEISIANSFTIQVNHNIQILEYPIDSSSSSTTTSSSSSSSSTTTSSSTSGDTTTTTTTTTGTGTGTTPTPNQQEQEPSLASCINTFNYFVISICFVILITLI